MSSEQERKPFKDLSDAEKSERINNMRSKAQDIRSQHKNGKYYSFGEAVDDIKNADGVGETTLASVKLVGKSIFNIGRFAIADFLPAMMEETAKSAEKSMRK